MVTSIFRNGMRRQRLLSLASFSVGILIVTIACQAAIGKPLLKVEYLLPQTHEFKRASQLDNNNSTQSLPTIDSNQSYSSDGHTLSSMYPSRTFPPEQDLHSEILYKDQIKNKNVNYCVNPKCFSKVVGDYNLSHAFPSRSDHAWTEADTKEPTKRDNNYRNSQPQDSNQGLYKYYGLLYVKVPKTGSSTVAGVMLRIASRVGSRQGGSIPVRVHHALPSKELYHSRRHPTKSFMVGSVRDPASRAVSFCFYDASLRKRLDVTERSIMRMLKRHDELGRWISDGRGGMQLSYLSLDSKITEHKAPFPVIPRQSVWRKDKPTEVNNMQLVHVAVKHVMENYDFIIVHERMEESLVALGLIMGIPIEDVLVAASSKVGHHSDQSKLSNASSSSTGSSGYTLGLSGDECVKLIATFRTRNMDRYLQSDEWYAMNYGDYLLHAAANESLDRTIDHVIGRGRFQIAISDYRQWSERITRYCTDGGGGRTTTVTNGNNDSGSSIHFPCSQSSGRLQLELSEKDCYQGDFGCGYPCMDEFLTLHGDHLHGDE